MNADHGRPKHSRREGFTIIELLVASAILLLVLTVAFSTYVVLSQYVKNTTTQATLQGRARIAFEKIVRNIRLASDLNCSPSGNQLELTFDPAHLGKTGSAWVSRYRLVGDEILYRPDISKAAEGLLIDDVSLDVGDKLFDYLGNDLIVVNLKVKKISADTVQDMELSTIVRLRNAD